MKLWMAILFVVSFTNAVFAASVQIGGIEKETPYVWNAPSGTAFPITLDRIRVSGPDRQVGTFDVILSTSATDATTVYHAGRRVAVKSVEGVRNPIEHTEPLYMTITNLSANISKIRITEVKTFYLDSSSESVVLHDEASGSQILVGEKEQTYRVTAPLQPVSSGGLTYWFETPRGSSWMLEHVVFDVTFSG